MSRPSRHRQSTPRPALSLSAAIEETSRSSLLSTGALAVIYMRCVCKCTRTRQLNWHYTALRTRHQECRRKGLLLSTSTVVEPNHIYYAIHSIAENSTNFPAKFIACRYKIKPAGVHRSGRNRTRQRAFKSFQVVREGKGSGGPPPIQIAGHVGRRFHLKLRAKVARPFFFLFKRLRPHPACLTTSSRPRPRARSI